QGLAPGRLGALSATGMQLGCNAGIPKPPARRAQPVRIEAEAGQTPAERALRPLAEVRMVGVMLLHHARVLVTEMPGDLPERHPDLGHPGRGGMAQRVRRDLAGREADARRRRRNAFLMLPTAKPPYSTT